MNFWKQTTHIMSYFPEENFRGHERLPKNFMNAFLEVRSREFTQFVTSKLNTDNHICRVAIRKEMGVSFLVYIEQSERRNHMSLF